LSVSAPHFNAKSVGRALGGAIVQIATPLIRSAMAAVDSHCWSHFFDENLVFRSKSHHPDPDISRCPNSAA
jgi:hypothetical protein